jgi:drug/metabolite transporter (DMT)-like permease
VVAAIFAVFLFAELPALLQVAGGLITIGGVFLYSKVEKNGE